ncbi:universal stress protein [Pandoraea sp.]|uniref:universal stress protein n=1 Tax=Pandoraea sp. TaxID=1883445 RepID=UPI00121C2C04|nr:universal stress protein [Pandoraea sp.]TAL56882.1 MAG: universal stress protein [Pandoraea sp.]TAM17676.1 MAG: universal stress protein [Pandoraea sp.]
MAAYNRILLCYDGSREGRKALRCGANLALDLKAETHVLAVVDIISNVAQSGGIMADVTCSAIETTTREILEEGVQWLTSRGVNATGHLAHGRPIEEIPRLAEKLNADLIVVGHQTRGTLARWWAGGSESAMLLDRVSCSLLVSVGADTEQS